MTAFRIASHAVTYQPVQAVISLTHICSASSHVNPCGRPKAEHRLSPVQHGQQSLQCPCIESATYFDPASASRLNHQNSFAPGITLCIPRSGRNYFDRKQGAHTRSRSTMHAPTIFIQRPHSQAALLAKRLPHQSTRFKLRNQRLDFRPASPPPHYSHFTHNSSALLNPAEKQGALL